MDDNQRNIIKKNLDALAEETNLDILLPRLIQKRIVPPDVADALTNHMQAVRETKRDLFLRVQSRGGPEAFNNLIEALNETGHNTLAHLLNPALGSPENQEDKFISLREVNQMPLEASSLLENEKRLSNINLSDTDSENDLLDDPLHKIDYGVEPLVIDVQKATKFYDTNEGKVLTYPMRSSKRGVYLIINIIDFVNDIQDRRTGADIDQRNLEELFFKMGFIGESYVNLDKTSIRETIYKFTCSDILHKTDSVVVVIMSHGNTNEYDNSFMFAHDGKHVYLSWILEKFNNVCCPALQNIPKIFLFQCCRGDYGDHGIAYVPPRRHHKSRIQKDSGASHVCTGTGMPTYSDMLICNATVPGFASYRDKHTGAFFIYEICKVWAEHACDTHVVDMMMIVDNNLRGLLSGDRKRQTPCYENRSFRHCYFHPGLYES